MSITRNTLRADGVTVGHAMDRDASFLRSIGINAPDGAPTLDEREEAYVDRIRDVVLAALDSVTPHSEGGCRDSDLPLLFPAIDAQARRQFNRSLGSEDAT